MRDGLRTWETGYHQALKDLLSAYGHNQAILVNEGQTVKMGMLSPNLVPVVDYILKYGKMANQ